MPSSVACIEPDGTSLWESEGDAVWRVGWRTGCAREKEEGGRETRGNGLYEKGHTVCPEGLCFLLCFVVVLQNGFFFFNLWCQTRSRNRDGRVGGQPTLIGVEGQETEGSKPPCAVVPHVSWWSRYYCGCLCLCVCGFLSVTRGDRLVEWAPLLGKSTVLQNLAHGIGLRFTDTRRDG